MGFIGGYVTPIIGINEEDKKDVYYVIDEIRFNSDISTISDQQKRDVRTRAINK